MAEDSTSPQPETFATPDDFGDIQASQLHASLGERLGAQAGEAFMGGVRSLARIGEYQRADAPAIPDTDEFSLRMYHGIGHPAERAAEVPIADAKERIKQEGLEGQVKLPEQPVIKQPVLDLMIAHANERRQYEAAVSRGPQGFIPDALGFITEIGAGMIDPVNAAAFSIPVVGEARFGKMLASAGESIMGRAAVRAGVGAAQGAVGTAVLQPADWWLHTKDGLDYTMTDALRSVVMGAGMGGAFHAGFDAVGDIAARRAGSPLPGSPEDLLARALVTPEAPPSEPVAPKAPSVMDRAGNRYEPVAPGLPREAPPDLTNAGAPGEEIPGIAPPPHAASSAEPPAAAGAPIEAQRDYIAADVKRQLLAAGRPEEEATAAAHLIAARYEARASRFNGALGTAEELYNREGAEIRAMEIRRKATTPAAARALDDFQQRMAVGREQAQRRRNEGSSAVRIMTPEQRYAGVTKEEFEAAKRDAIEAAPDLRSLMTEDDWEFMGSREFHQIEAYHGSPHHFERFDVSKIGTGEGAQAYGHGLYFAENEGVARGYKEKLSGTLPRSSVMSPAILSEYFKPGEIVNTMWGRDRVLAYDPQTRRATVRAVDNAGKPLEGIDGRTRTHTTTPEWNEVVSTFRQRGTPIPEPGALYRVSLKPDKEDLLDWDKPLSEQSEKVKAAIKKLPLSQSDMKDILGDQGFSGMHLVQALNWHPSVTEGSAANTSRALREAGIPGIKYADAGSRASPQDIARMRRDLEFYRRSALNAEGANKEYFANLIPKLEDELRAAENPSHNFVIFDHKDVEITHRNGEALTKAERADAIDELEQRREDATEGRQFFQRKAGPSGPNLFTEREGEGQTNLPGTERISEADLAKRRAAEPLKPGVAQKPMDFGLFGDEAKQGSLFQHALGSFLPRESKPGLIKLAKDANASTFMHESGHDFLEQLMRDDAHPLAPAELKADAQAVRDWLGIENHQDLNTGWPGERGKNARAAHEKFARGFEQYLRDGQAPSSALAAVFEKFKAWLTAIYRSLTELGAPISDDVRAVLDRMLATDEQIAAARAHPAAVLADLPPRVREDALRATVADVTAGNTARTGEMLNEAAKEDPRIAESVADRSGTTTVKPFGNFAPESIRPDQRPQAARADWGRVADARRSDDEDLVEASKQAEKTPEPASIDPEKAPSAAEAAAREADALLAEMLPRLSDDERRTFEDALNQLDQDKAAQEQIVRDGAACLAAAVA